MSSFRFLLLNLLGGSLLLLLTAVCEAEEYGYVTPVSDYDPDYNATFDYSFYSNTSIEDLDEFSKQFINPDEDEDQEGKDDTGGQQGEEEGKDDTGGQQGEEEGKDDTGGQQGQEVVYSVASLPVSLELRMLVGTLFILMVVNLQQL
ncbi:uncharacterized protein [Leuresthes tenuis]|uniref:uncharacterized protein n=1 Tax=Leuresthes tenuis TaxID=355514 RepID=UPI003B512321